MTQAGAIWKFELKPGLGDEARVEMPVGAAVLHVGFQDDYLYVWALVDTSPELPKQERLFSLRGTGHEVSFDAASRAKFVGSAVHPNVPLVMHVWEGSLLPGEVR